MFDMPASSLTLPQRFLSVDVLRGLTITLMIVVNNPGDEAHVWWPLDHAVWSGYTLADLVFPTFLYLIGCSVVYERRSKNRPQSAA
jgi:predicted acyltransferase